MDKQHFTIDQYLEELKPLINVDCGTWTLEGVSKIAGMMSEKIQKPRLENLPTPL